MAGKDELRILQDVFKFATTVQQDNHQNVIGIIKPVRLKIVEKFPVRIVGLKLMEGKAQHRAVVIIDYKNLGTALLWIQKSLEDVILTVVVFRNTTSHDSVTTKSKMDATHRWSPSNS
ncbi:hypothetical protein N7G274_005458 [Stereocaulon virgatum]|uniref:Uncharacterized protein n=1 Tax=Stereocaulon virgatum TaxID=373712 RepID=A0ABR4AAB6_9LECA